MTTTIDAMMPASAQNSGDNPVGQTMEQQLPMLRQRLMRQARATVYDVALAEDLVQETLLAVFEQESSRRGQVSLSTWATAILQNKVADWYRSPNRTRFVQQAEGIEALHDATGHYAQQVPSWQQPDNHLEQRQMFTILEQCVSRLPAQTGRVLMMREWLDFETVEICSRLSLTADNCHMILHRPRMGMRGCMQLNWINHKVSTRALLYPAKK